MPNLSGLQISGSCCVQVTHGRPFSRWTYWKTAGGLYFKTSISGKWGGWVEINPSNIWQHPYLASAKAVSVVPWGGETDVHRVTLDVLVSTRWKLDSLCDKLVFFLSVAFNVLDKHTSLTSNFLYFESEFYSTGRRCRMFQKLFTDIIC
jgi:hypothetical protein